MNFIVLLYLSPNRLYNRLNYARLINVLAKAIPIESSCVFCALKDTMELKRIENKNVYDLLVKIG